MFLKISANKTRYDKGQIFPFLIAIIVVIIIIAMIMVNLGQIGLFKTDVSNAADSAALSGASILSGYLLGVGLQSDMMSGQMIVEVAALVTSIVAGVILIVTGAVNEDPKTVGQGIKIIVAGIVTYIATWVKALVTWFQMMEQGKMAWSNAKKTALQYAFQNAGIDEPRPTFKQFLNKVYGVSEPYPATLPCGSIESCNEIYFRGDDPAADTATREKIQKYTENGFSRFMRETDGTPGYWTWGKIKPGNISPPIVTAGYGWSQIVEANGNIIDINSFDENRSYDEGCPQNCRYDNYVEVEVIGNVMYPLRIYMGAKLIQDINDAVWDRVDKIEDDHPVLGFLLGALVAIVNIILSPILAIAATCPAGLMMGDGEIKTLKEQTDGNPITVTVKRYKKESDLGLWTFRYGAKENPGIVEAQAQAHAYRENDDIDIKPVLKDGVWQQEIISSIAIALGCVIAASVVAIVAGILIKALRIACITASAACLLLAPLCVIGCWVAAIGAYILVGIALVAAVKGCINVLAKPKAEDQFKWFYTGRHLFETELTKAR